MSEATGVPMTVRKFRVLESVDPPGATVKFIDQVVRYAPDDIEFTFFSWRSAILGRYDVFHVHWPEFLIRSSRPAVRRMQRLLYRLLLVRLRLTRTPVVRTLHNHAPHAEGDAEERKLLKALDDATTLRVLISEADATSSAGSDRVVLHGDYREQFASLSRAEPTMGRLLFFGRIEPYKSVPALVRAFEEAAVSGDELRIVGRPSSHARADIERQIRKFAREDATVSTRFEHTSDEDMVGEITRAEVLVLPYTEMHNSGVLLVALSLGRPVIAPASPANDALAREVGDGWIVTYEGAFDSDKLADALSRLRATRRDAPRLEARDWRVVAAGHARAFRDAAEIVRETRRTPRIYVNVGGQRDNIGDSLLRRAYLDALRPHGRLYAYTGPDAEYTSGLGLQETDTAFSSPRSWLIAAFRSALARPTVFAVNTGEVVGTTEEHRKGRWQEPLAWLIKRRGGRVVVAGVSVRPGSSIDSTSLPRIVRKADYVSWRDEWTRGQLGQGNVQPDWAFGLGRGAAEGDDRSLLAIAMRGDRPLPSDKWFDDVREVLRTTSTRPIVVVQVRRDLDRARELAARLDAELLDWPVESGHDVQEARVRAVYRGASAVISDRIHALIVGFTEGAVPLGFSTESPEKVIRSLSPATSVEIVGAPGASLAAWKGALERRAELFEDLAQARRRLSEVSESIGQSISSL